MAACSFILLCLFSARSQAIKSNMTNGKSSALAIIVLVTTLVVWQIVLFSSFSAKSFLDLDRHFVTPSDEESDASSSSTDTSDAATSSISSSCQPMVQRHTGHKKVLLTGGAGFIGSHVGEFLLQRDDTVIVVDELNSYYNVSLKLANLDLLKQMAKPGQLKFYKGDVANETFLEQVFEEERPQWICHMAARAGVRPSIQDPFVYIHSNVLGTTRILDMARKFHVQNVVVASSSSVYGGLQHPVFDEAASVDAPISPYAATKKSTELMAYTYHHLYGLNISALRFFTVYGPRGRPDMAPFMFIDRVSRGVEIQQFGDGSSVRDYTYISDIVQGVVNALDHVHGYQIFNLGRGQPNMLRDFIATVEKHTGTRANIVKKPSQAGDVPYTCANVTKASCLIGYQPKVMLDEGIRQTVEWYNATYL